MKYYEEQFRLSKHRQFGASSEKSEYDQQSLFNEAENTARSVKYYACAMSSTQTRQHCKCCTSPVKHPRVKATCGFIERAVMPVIRLSYMNISRIGGQSDPTAMRGITDYLTTPPLSGRFAHAHRKWDEALKAMPSKDRNGSQVLRGKRFCDRLFELERQFVDLPCDERFSKRQELAKPILDVFKAWLDALNYTPKSALGIAAYSRCTF